MNPVGVGQAHPAERLSFRSQHRRCQSQCPATHGNGAHPKGIIPPQRQYAAETVHDRNTSADRRVVGQEPLVEIYADEAVMAASSHGKHRHSNAVSVRRDKAASRGRDGPDPSHKGMGSVSAIDYDQLFSASGRARGPDALAAMAHLSDTNNIQVRMHGGLPAASSFPFESFSYKLRTGPTSTVIDPQKASSHDTVCSHATAAENHLLLGLTPVANQMMKFCMGILIVMHHPLQVNSHWEYAQSMVCKQNVRDC